MSGRKESLKKSLGLTEYPWSSDDEDNPPTNNLETPPTSNRRQSDNSSQPGSSGVVTSTPSDNWRQKTRLERDLFWSLLSNPNRASSAGSSRTSSSYKPRAKPSFQHILAISKYKPNHITNSQNSDYHAPTSRPGRIERHIIATVMDDNERASTFRPRSILRPPSNLRPRSILRAPSQRAVQYSEDESDAPVQNNLPESETNPNNVGEQEVINVDASRGEEEEEVEEVDAEDDDHERNNGPQEEIAEDDHDRDDDNEEESTENSAAVELTLPGMKRRHESQCDNEPNSVQEFNHNLLRLLECPVCLEWMEPPITQCRRGHLVCNPCRSRIPSCPVCRTAFSSVRNRAMEAVAELLRYPCRYGCGRVTHFRRRATHESSCSARRYRCPALTCSHRLPATLADLADHFQADHPSILKMGPRHNFSIRVNSERHDVWLVNAMHELFQLRVNIDINNWGVWFYVAYIGPKCNASSYTYEVTVSGPQNSRKLVYSRSTHSDLESTSLNVSRQDCFHMTLEQALNFLRYKNPYSETEKYLDFVVDISKSEPPTKAKVDKTDS